MFNISVNDKKNIYRSKPVMNVDTVPKPLTYDYMPEGYPSKSVGTVTLMEEQELAFADIDGTYGATAPVKIDISDGQTYTVVWDGVEYSCAGHTIQNINYIGNPAAFGLEATSEPFLYANMGQYLWVSYDSAASHTIKVTIIDAVYQTIDENFLPIPPRQVRNLDTHKLYSTEEIEEIYQSARDGAAIYLIHGDVIRGISYNPNDSFTYILPSGQEDTIRPVDGAWDFTNRETTYPSSITFDSVYYDYAYIACDYNGVGGFDHEGYELIGTNMAGFNGDYIQAGHSIVLKLRDAPYYLYISATTNGEIEIEKRGSGLTSGGETTTLFKNGDRSMILKSSTEGSTKKFKITVDDSGTISATEVT